MPRPAIQRTQNNPNQESVEQWA